MNPLWFEGDFCFDYLKREKTKKNEMSQANQNRISNHFFSRGAVGVKDR